MAARVIDLGPLERALASLERALARPKDEFTRDAVVQRFEYSFELAWKAVKRVLAEREGVDAAGVRNVMRLAGRHGLVEAVEPWLAFQEARNLTSHTYNEGTAEEVYAKARQFLPAAQALLARLRERAACD